MEIKLLNDYIKEMKTGKHAWFESKQYQDNRFLITVLRNLHKEHHSIKCFKKKNNQECRMNIPSKEAYQTILIFDEKETEWFDWTGKRFCRNLFVAVHKRQHEDCFVNMHNDICSYVFNCNSNVVAAVDGGSIMYVTCYVSKNTNEEDTHSYVTAGKRMITKLREVYDADEEDEMQLCRKGVRTLMGAVIIATRSHMVSTPMASYLLRNGSRFGFAHDFQYLDFKTFAGACMDDLILTSNYNGSAYLKSLVLTGFKL